MELQRLVNDHFLVVGFCPVPCMFIIGCDMNANYHAQLITEVDCALLSLFYKFLQSGDQTFNVFFSRMLLLFSKTSY
jgi:hypothetical protein